MDRRRFLAATQASAAALSMPAIASAQAPNRARVFRWVPHADLTILDPVFSTVFITNIHAQLVWDTLYGLDDKYQPHPQMAAGHTSENNGLLWKITLRDGLKFHDGTPVRAQDAVASIRRWAKRDLMGQSLMDATEELSAVSDQMIQFRLKRPFPLILHALARPSGSTAIIMPEKLAETPENQQVRNAIGSGPFRFASAPDRDAPA